MKRIILVSMLFCVFTSVMHLDAQWVRTYGGYFRDSAYSIQQTNDGGYIVAGCTKSFIADPHDMAASAFWVLKMDSIGDVEWERTYGGDDYEGANSIQQTRDGGYIVGGFTDPLYAQRRDFWVLKLASTGDIEWQRVYEKSGDDFETVIHQTRDDGYFITGYTQSLETGHSVWALKLTSTGDVEWQKSYGGSKYDSAYASQQTSDDGYIVVGQTASWGAGYCDFWVIKLSPTGEIEWENAYGGVAWDIANAVHQTSDDGYIVAGQTESFGAPYRDFWVIKLTSTGDVEWEHAYRVGSVWSGKSCIAHSAQQTVDGGYIVTGQVGGDIWALKLSSIGTIEWQYVYEASGHKTAVQQTGDGGYVIAGETSDRSAGEGDFLILKLLLDGSIDPSCKLRHTSDAMITDTYSSVESTLATSQDTDAVPLDTTVVPQDTNAIVSLCGPERDLAISAGKGGTTKPSPGMHTYYIGTEIRVEAVPYQSHRFNGWTGNVPAGHENDNPVTITMDSYKSITANFVIVQYTLTIAATTGGTTNPEPGDYVYAELTAVTITATPDSGYEFSGWSGDASGTENPITVTMDSDKSVTANFSVISSEEPPYTEPKKDGCFIATAAYGSPLHPHIDILREFRDKHLMTNKTGRTLVKLYYKYSPPIAKLIARNKAVKITIRIVLLPLVGLSCLMIH